MRILVTGASGFVGQHVVPELLKRGYVVTALGRDEKKARKFEWFENVRFIECDIHHLVDNLYDKLDRPETIVHLAWPGLPNYSSLIHFERTLPDDYHFLKVMIEGGVRQLLITGTCLEYGMQSGQLAESTPTSPSIPYGLAKDTLNRFLRALQIEKSFTLQWCRLFYLYGNGQSPHSLLSQLDRAIDSGSRTFNMSHGTQLRDYLPIQIAARRLVNVVQNRDFNGVINICSGKPISVRDLVEQHLSSRNKDIQLNLGYYSHPDYEPIAFWGKTDFPEVQNDISRVSNAR